MSLTKGLEAYILDHSHKQYGSHIVLVDTPRFDDLKGTNEQILDDSKRRDIF